MLLPILIKSGKFIITTCLKLARHHEYFIT